MSEQSANLIGQILLPVLQTCCKKLAKCINVYLFLELCLEILTIHYGADVEIENVYILDSFPLESRVRNRIRTFNPSE